MTATPLRRTVRRLRPVEADSDSSSGVFIVISSDRGGITPHWRSSVAPSVIP